MNPLSCADNHRTLIAKERLQPLITASVLAFVTAIVFVVGGNQLLLGGTDALHFMSQYRNFLNTGALSFGGPRDYLSGLGTYPDYNGVGLNVPVFLALQVPTQWFESVYATVLCLSFFVSGYTVAASLGLRKIARHICGVATCFALFLPTPLLLTRFNYYQLSSFSEPLLWIALAQLIGSGLVERESRGQFLRVAVAVFCLVWASIVASFGTVMLVVVWVTAGLSWITATLVMRRKESPQNILWILTTWIAGLLALGVMFLGPLAALRDTPTFDHSLSDIASQYARPYFLDYMNLSFLGGNAVVLGKLMLLFLAGTGAILLGRKYKRYSQALWILFLAFAQVGYSVTFWAFARHGIEVGVNPAYIEAYLLLPAVVVAVSVVVTDGLSFAISHLSFGNRRLLTDQLAIRCLIVGLLLWVGVWTIDNRDLRHLRTEYQPSELTSYLAARLAGPQFRGRIAILEPANRPDREFAASTEKYLSEFLSSKIPVLNSYSHMNSKRSVEFINDWLTVGDVKGRPVLTVTRLNTEILRMLGVAYVISEQQLSVSPNITLVKNVSGMFLYRLRDPNLGNYSPTRVVSTAESGAASAVLGINPVEQVITNSELPRLSRAKTTSLSLRPGHVRVSVATSATSLVILPIEISGCMRIVSGDVSATLVRVNGLLAGLLVSKSGDYEVVDGRPAIAPTSCFYASARS